MSLGAGCHGAGSGLWAADMIYWVYTFQCCRMAVGPGLQFCRLLTGLLQPTAPLSGVALFRTPFKGASSSEVPRKESDEKENLR